MSDFLRTLQRISEERRKEWTDEEAGDPLFHAVEFGEEAGEVLGDVKKLERENRGWRGSRTTIGNLGDEMGDALITLVNLANCYGIDLAEVTSAKFNKTSEKVGLRYYVYPPTEEEGELV